MRVCRISRIHPHTNWPASGLIPFSLSRDLPYQSLYIAKNLGGKPLPFPQNVELKVITYPEPRVPEKMSLLMLPFIAAGKIFGSLIFVAWALPQLLRFKPHIVHVHTPLPLALGILGKKIFGTPLIMSFEGTDYHRFLRSQTVQFLVRKWVDALVCVSKEMEHGVRDLMPEKHIIYAPSSVDTTSFRNECIERQDRLIVVGRLVWQKGIEYLLEAMKQVVSQRPNTKLLIVGDGPLRDDLENQVKTLCLEANVEFVGTLEPSAIPHLLNESRLFVSSSVSEGLPKALLEAMACGTPTVVTDVGDCGIVTEGAGLVVKPKDADALADAILRMLNDEAIWQVASRQAVATARDFTWEARAEKILHEYEKLLKSQGKPQLAFA